MSYRSSIRVISFFEFELLLLCSLISSKWLHYSYIWGCRNGKVADLGPCFSTSNWIKLLGALHMPSSQAPCSASILRHQRVCFVLQKLCMTFAQRLAQNWKCSTDCYGNECWGSIVCRLLPDGYVMSNSTSWGTLCFEWSQQKQKVVVRLSTTPWKSFLIKAPPCPFIIQLYIIRMLQLSVPIRLVFFHANQFDSTTIC